MTFLSFFNSPAPRCASFITFLSTVGPTLLSSYSVPHWLPHWLQFLTASILGILSFQSSWILWPTGQPHRHLPLKLRWTELNFLSHSSLSHSSSVPFFSKWFLPNQFSNQMFLSFFHDFPWLLLTSSTLSMNLIHQFYVT